MKRGKSKNLRFLAGFGTESQRLSRLSRLFRLFEKIFGFVKFWRIYLVLIGKEVDGRCRPLQKMSAKKNCGI